MTRLPGSGTSRSASRRQACREFLRTGAPPDVPLADVEQRVPVARPEGGRAVTAGTAGSDSR